MKIVIITMFIISSIVWSAAQKTETVELNVITSCNDEFNSILKNIVELAKDKDYYSEDMFFSVRIIRENECCDLIQIEGIGRRLFPFGNELGVINCHNHLFVLYGNKVSHALFQGTDKSLHVEYSTIRNDISEHGEVIFDAAAIYTDIYDVWVYKYCEGNLTLVAFGSPNDPESFNDLK